MIKEKFRAIRDILFKQEDLVAFNKRYRQGPDLYFYKRVIDINNKSKSIEDFLGNDYHIELLYATLVSWDMNSRGAKMEYFDKFKKSILMQKDSLKLLWKKKIAAVTDVEKTLNTVAEIYDNLHLMKTGGRLVSNSKVLHYILPDLLMPMDRQNTLVYFYKYTTESRQKYLNIIRGSFEMVNDIGRDAEYYLDAEWNRTIPKTIDNAILMKMGTSLK